MWSLTSCCRHFQIYLRVQIVFSELTKFILKHVETDRVLLQFKIGVNLGRNTIEFISSSIVALYVRRWNEKKKILLKTYSLYMSRGGMKTWERGEGGGGGGGMQSAKFSPSPHDAFNDKRGWGWMLSQRRLSSLMARDLLYSALTLHLPAPYQMLRPPRGTIVILTPFSPPCRRRRRRRFSGPPSISRPSRVQLNTESSNAHLLRVYRDGNVHSAPHDSSKELHKFVNSFSRWGEKKSTQLLLLLLPGCSNPTVIINCGKAN